MDYHSNRRASLAEVGNKPSFPLSRKAARKSMVPTMGSSHRHGLAGAGAGGASAASRRKSTTGLYGRGSEDPRPITDRDWRKVQAAKLRDYLLSHDYPGGIPDKLLSNGGPSARNVIAVTVFLFQKLDPQFGLRSKNDAHAKLKVEEEIAEAFKMLKYVKLITADKLRAPNQITWPQYVLPALTWLIDNINILDDLEGRLEIDDRQFLFDHVSNSYSAFLQGLEEREEEIKTADQAVFRSRIEELESLKAQAAEKAARLEEEKANLLCEESSLAGIRDRNRVLASDASKFESLVTKLVAHKQDLSDRLEEASKEVTSLDGELVDTRDHIVALERQRDEQELSALDVDRMKQEGSLLKQGIREAVEVRETAQRQLHDLEREYQRVTGAVKSAVMAYNDAVEPMLETKKDDSSKMQALRAKLPVELTFGSGDAVPRITPSKREVKSALAGLRSAFSKRAMEYTDVLRTLHDKMEAGSEAAADKRKENEMLGEQLASLEAALASEKATLEDDLSRGTAELDAINRKIDAAQNQQATFAEQAEDLKGAAVEKLAAEIKAEEDTLAKEREVLQQAILTSMTELTAHINCVQHTLAEGVTQLKATKASVKDLA